MSEKPPLRYFTVSTESVVRRRHERLIVARSAEDALAYYQKGTAWPSDYDAHTVAVLERDPVTVDAMVDEEGLRGDPNDPANLLARAYYTDELQAEIPWPESAEHDEFLKRGSEGDIYEDDELRPATPSEREGGGGK